MRANRVLCVLFAIGLVAAPAVHGQGSGRIVGKVSRASGAGVGGVAVVIAETGAAALTDNSGNYSFSAVPAGSYELSFTLGSNTATEPAEVTAGATTRVDKQVDWDISFAETITVMSASRRAERIVEAPAAVTLVTAEEVERQSAHGQLPKLLEFTPGAEVTQSGIYDYNFNTRGFNSSLNRRVATLIDGRDPSVPFLGAQEWAAISFPLDDIASLELVRGPSAALYGANASSGVLNMVTKQPRYSSGGLVRITGGELSTLNGDFRWAGSLGNDFYLKLLGGVRNSGDFTVSRRFNFLTGQGTAEYSRPCPFPRGNAVDCLPQEVIPLDPLDDNQIYFAGVRLDKEVGDGALFSIEGGTASVEGPVFQTGIGRVQLVEVDRPWARANFNTTHWNFLVDYTTRDAPRQAALGSGANLALDTERLHAELQTNWAFAEDKARVVVGLSYEEEDINSADPRTGRQTLVFAPINSDSQALFAQLDWAATDKLKIVVAGRYDESTLHDSQLSPKGSLVYSFTPSHTLRLTYNEAFQVPNYSEFFLQAPAAPSVNLQPFEGFCAPAGVSCGFAPGPTRVLALGNAALEVEEVETIEVGYSGILGGKAFLTVDYYMSDNQNFITDLLPQLGTALGRINPAFGLYQPPAALPAPLQAALLAALRGALGPTFFILSNNVDGSPILAAASYTNFGEVDTQGVDVGLNYYLDDSWTVSFTYSWFDFDIKSGAAGLTEILLPNSPENKASFGLTYARDRFDAGFAVRWVDDFRWVVGPFQGNIPAYETIDVNANYQVHERVKLGLNVANLADDEHWEAFGGDLLSRRALGSVTFTW